MSQSFENHAKMVSGYHYVAASLIVFPTIYFGVLAVTDFSMARVALFAFCAGTVMVAFYARTFPLGVQDRVIRLEERMRLERLLPDDLRSRVLDFETEQLIALRFASDDELPSLARKVLDEGIGDRKSIKRAVKSWRADNQRI